MRNFIKTFHHNQPFKDVLDIYVAQNKNGYDTTPLKVQV